MRIKIKNNSEFFKDILDYNGITLKKLSEKINLNYNTLKNYKRGINTIPESIF